MFLFVIIVLGLIILSSIISIPLWIIVRLLKNNSHKSDIEKEVKEGFKSAVKELEYEKDQNEELMESIQKNDKGIGIFSSVDSEEQPIHSGGELIPFGLSDSEKDILRMFYNK